MSDGAEQGLIGVRRGADHELHRHARRPARVQPVDRPPMRASFPLPEHQPAHLLEVGAGRVPLFVRGNQRQAGTARRLEVDRDPARELGQPVDLRRLRARNHLDVDVPAEPVALPQQLQRLDELVHDVDGPAGNPRGDEQALAPAAPERAQEDAHQLFGFEQRPRKLPVAPHRAVVAVEAAGVGHEHAEQPGAAGSGAKVADVERAQGAGPSAVPEPGRRRGAVPVVRGEGHQDVQLLLEIRPHARLRWWASGTIPE